MRNRHIIACSGIIKAIFTFFIFDNDKCFFQKSERFRVFFLQHFHSTKIIQSARMWRSLRCGTLFTQINGICKIFFRFDKIFFFSQNPAQIRQNNGKIFFFSFFILNLWQNFFIQNFRFWQLI